MQFAWKQVCDFLYPVDQVSLRVSCQLTANCIPMCRVYAFANKLVVEELANDDYCNPEMRDYIKFGFLYGSFLTSCLFGIDMGDFFTCQAEIIVCQLTNTPDARFKYHGDNGIYKVNCASYLYVANWNALIERSCNVTQIANPQRFNCFHSIETDFIRSLHHFRALGFNIEVDVASFCQDSCINCRRKRWSLCIDSKSDCTENMEDHDLLFDQGEDDDDHVLCKFERRAKISSRKRAIMRKTKMLKNKHSK